MYNVKEKISSRKNRDSLVWGRKEKGRDGI
jgi:hypothetical protein